MGLNNSLHLPQSASCHVRYPPLPVRPETTRVAQVFRRRPDIEPQESIPEVPAPERYNIFSPVEDRWRLGYQRNLLNPYKQNVLKGDYPIVGQHTFLVCTGISDTLLTAM